MRTFMVKVVTSKHTTQAEAERLLNREAEEFTKREGITRYESRTIHAQPFPLEPALLEIAASFVTDQ